MLLDNVNATQHHPATRRQNCMLHGLLGVIGKLDFPFLPVFVFTATNGVADAVVINPHAPLPIDYTVFLAPTARMPTIPWQPRSPTRRDNNVYIPHPAPNAAGNEEDSEMGGALSLVKTLLIPAITSLLLYLLISYLLAPLWRRCHPRYSQYLPLDAISSRTTPWRQQVQSVLTRYLSPSSWASDYARNQQREGAEGQIGSDFDEEDGEELFEVDDNRREALSLDARRGRDDFGRRLSRELEEGFKDDSDDEDGDDQRRSI
ncbi:hypothetical protein B7494_g2407 [Chlorociboria aeruginascens]|nr:hypothetical protein B7494_g2407 [Chlorociboria aeruginascens]